MTRIALLLAFVGLVPACSKDNPYFCDDACKMMADAAVEQTGCTTNDECSGGTPVCNVAAATCVACTSADNGSCGSMLCSATNECQRCVAHDECTASDACLTSTGECLDTTAVAYVAATGSDSNPCTKATPCLTLTHAATQKAYVKLQTNIVETVSLQNNVTVLAEPHTLISRASGNDNAVVTVGGTSNVVLSDVVVTGGATAAGHGISVNTTTVNLTLDHVVLHTNTGLGLLFNGGMLTISRSIVTNNFGGGADIHADFDITNSMFVSNGTGGSSFGGLRLLPNSTKKVFSFNTVANNNSSDAQTNGLNCSGSMPVSATIVANNAATNLCAFSSSMFDTTTTPVGTNNNIQGLPVFKSVNASLPLSPDFYRIDSTSAAIDAVTVPMPVLVDIDGDARPQGGMRDIGADEYR